MTATGPDAVFAGASARLAHEIRNALAGIAGALDVLKDHLPPEPELEVVLGRVRSEVARIDGCVGELSVFARTPSPVLKVRSVHDVIDRALHGAAASPTTRLARDYVAGLAPIPVDETLLGDALRRLIRNATDAMPAGGVLTVTTRATTDVVRISVRDTGPGICTEDREALFAPFYSSKTRGLGLGLAIARRLVEAHGGRLTASGPDGFGAEFTIELPANR